MLYPIILPLSTMFDTLFKDAEAAQRKLKVFWIVFFWLVACHFRAELGLTPLELVTASFSGRYSQNGCSLFSQGFQYFVWPIRGLKTSREFLEDLMEMKDWGCYRFASTGNISQEVLIPWRSL